MRDIHTFDNTIQLQAITKLKPYIYQSALDRFDIENNQTKFSLPEMYPLTSYRRHRLVFIYPQSLSKN